MDSSALSTSPVYQVHVVKHGSNNFKIRVDFHNPKTTRRLKKEFIVHIADSTKNKDLWSLNVVTGAVLQYMEGQSHLEFINSKSKREKGLGVYRILKQITKRKGFEFLLQKLEVEGKLYNSYSIEDANRTKIFGGTNASKRKKKKITGACDAGAAASCGEEDGEREKINSKEGEVEGEGEDEVGGKDKYDSPIIRASREVIAQKAISTPQVSIFKPAETGATYSMIGKSKSGKTTFIVNQLNRMTEQEVEGYNVIVFFTTSLHANPLKDLAPHVKKRMLMVGRFVPKILQAMKRINDETNNRFKFLIICDDILKLRGDLMSECILTLRNSNISTVISMQYVKLMTPAQRDSVHNIYIFNLKTELWDFMLRGFIFGNVKEEVPPLRPIKRITEAALVMRQIMNPYILYHDQVNDTTEFYNKKT